MDTGTQSLPILKVKDAFLDAMIKNDVILLVGETGSGKTTQIPQFIHKANSNVRIAITQPRRVAAISLARRVADELGHKELGGTVGYSVRFDECSARDGSTKIKFLTDGMLLREAIGDTSLDRYDVVIVDEAHERTLRTDILFGMLKGMQAKRSQKNPNQRRLKVVIMSATMNTEKFAEYFKRPIDGSSFVPSVITFTVPGRQYPVRVFHTENAVPDYLDAVVSTILQIEETQMPGDILVFLTGQDEIERVSLSMKDRDPGTSKDGSSKKAKLRFQVLPLHASLNASQQMRVFVKTPTNVRKIILSTNIAETSITIPGVRFVVDTGLVKLRSVLPNGSGECLRVVPISVASAKQRAGRAGREAPGECYRLYTEQTYDTGLVPETSPEIVRTALSSVLLTMLASGAKDIMRFPFLDAPSLDSIRDGLAELVSLDVIKLSDSSIELPKGRSRFIAEAPVAPNLATVLYEAPSLGVLDEILCIISMLSSGAGDSPFINIKEEDELDISTSKDGESSHKSSFTDRSGDHLTLLRVFRSYQSAITESKADEKTWCRRHKLCCRFMKSAHSVYNQLALFVQRTHPLLKDVNNPTKDTEMSEDKAKQIMRCISSGFFANTAFLQPDGSYLVTTIGSKTAQSGRVYVHPSSTLFNSKEIRRPGTILLFHELVITTRSYMRNVSILPESNMLIKSIDR